MCENLKIAFDFFHRSVAILLREVSCRAHVRSSVVITVLSTCSGTLPSTKKKRREGATSVRFSNVGAGGGGAATRS